MELLELFLHGFCHGLLLTHIYIGGEGDRGNGNHDARACNVPVEVDIVELAVGAHVVAEGNEACHAGNGCEEDEREGHRPGSLVRRVVRMEFLVLRAPEDAEVEAEHIESRHGGDARHDPTHCGVIGKGGRENFIFREETREGRYAGDGKTSDEERPVGDGHVLAQSAHRAHLVAVHGVDNATRAEEEQCLEHGVGEEVEHGSHVAEAAHVFMTRSPLSANAERHHHKGDLRNGREGEHALDVALGTCHGGGIESGERAHPSHDAQSLRGILDPQGEEASHLEHTCNDHRSSVDKG